jgi:hypothetical protein
MNTASAKMPVAIAGSGKRRSRIASAIRGSALALMGVMGAAGAAHALVGDWASYTHLQDVRDLQTMPAGLFAATSGGIIRVSPSGTQRVYRNTEGLRDVGISALVPGASGELYASSELGYLYRYDASSDDWDVLSTSYRGAGWTMSERALLYRQGYLVVGSDKGLSFFNIDKKVAEANVSKMEGANGIIVNGLLFVGDTLFAGTNRGIFRATLHVDKLLTDPSANIFNPGIWSRVPGTDGALFFRQGSRDSVGVQDSLTTVSDITNAITADPLLHAHGFLRYGPDGIESEYAGSAVPDSGAMVSTFGSVTIAGRTAAPSIRMKAIAFMAGKWYTGAAHGLYLLDAKAGTYSGLYNPENIPQEGITAVKANRYGVHAFATPIIYELHGNVWDSVKGMVVRNSAEDTKNRGQHAFDVPARGEYFVGTWGSGFQAFRNGAQESFDALNSCVASALETEPNYPVVWSQTPYKNKGILFTVWKVGKRYDIGYYDYGKGSVSCFSPEVKDPDARNIQVVGDSVLAVVTERSVEAYRIIDNGVAVTLDPVNRMARVVNPGIALLAGKMDRAGNFWVTTAGSLLYLPAVKFHQDSVQTFHTLDGFAGSNCMNLELDPQGHLWAGCTEGGVFEIIPGKDTLSHTFRHYGLNDGLLSEVIFHLDVNPDNGDVWVATEKGLARYESASRPNRPNLDAAKVFPNPFLPKHESVVFANLSPGSEIQVLTQSGSVVWHKSLSTGMGDQIKWDGRNRAGARITEGVYFYVIRSASETKNGKIIVAR